MSLSRKQLERWDMPFGESCTRREGGRMIYGGGGGGSSSSSSNATTTTNIDRRQVVAEGAVGLASDSSTVNVTMTDDGIVKAALDVVKNNDATNGAGFEKVLTLAEKLFDTGSKLVDKTADTSMAAVAAVNTARNDAVGAIDQKTLIILGAVGLGAAVIFKRKG